MAITIETQPQDFGRVYDTNRLTYKLSSTHAAEPNFRFYIRVYVGDITKNPIQYEKVGTVRKRPLQNGTCFFNPSELWNNYITHDLEIDISSLQEALNSNSSFYISIAEEYGDPIHIDLTPVESNKITLYNGLQEYIPYDIEAYGGGNNQWVMGSEDIVEGYTRAGTWTSTNNSSVLPGEIYIVYDYPPSVAIVSLRNITGGFNSNIPNISPGEYVVLKNTSDTTKSMILTFDSQVDHETYTIWQDITIVSNTMPQSYFNDGEKLTIDWQELNNTEGQGKFLTDALDFQVDNKDYSNLYFLSSKDDRPSAVRIKVYYWSDGSLPGGLINPPERGLVTNNSRTLQRKTNKAESVPNPTIGFEQDDSTGSDIGRPTLPEFTYFISSYNTGYNLSYTNVNNQMYYIPSGPQELSDKGIFDWANSKGGWVSYKIDLVDDYNNPTKIFNKYPMWFYRKDKCEKYDPWQIFWMNPHGGFDRYTFYKKNYISYDLERTTWEHRFSDEYVLGERGKTIYKTKATKNIELNTDWLSASEAQTLGQMMMSPEIFAVYEYKGNVYKIPYVINDGDFDYKEVKNEKVVSMKINITPAWNRVSQTT